MKLFDSIIKSYDYCEIDDYAIFFNNVKLNIPIKNYTNNTVFRYVVFDLEKGVISIYFNSDDEDPICEINLKPLTICSNDIEKVCKKND